MPTKTIKDVDFSANNYGGVVFFVALGDTNDARYAVVK